MRCWPARCRRSCGGWAGSPRWSIPAGGAAWSTCRRWQAAGLVSQVAAAGPPLCAVLHAAGLVQDTALDQATVAGLAGVLAAKAGGAAVLDELTAGLGLDAFVLFSSIAATWGSGRQPGYAAANAFL